MVSSSASMVSSPTNFGWASADPSFPAAACVRRPRAIMGDAAEVPKEEEAKPVRAAAPRAQPAPRASTGTPRRQQRTLPSVAQTKTNAAATLLARPCLC